MHLDWVFLPDVTLGRFAHVDSRRQKACVLARAVAVEVGVGLTRADKFMCAFLVIGQVPTALQIIGSESDPFQPLTHGAGMDQFAAM